MGTKLKKDSFLGHLEVLRWVLVKCFMGIIVFTVIAVIYSSFIFDEILFAPKNIDFISYKWYCSLIDYFNLDPSSCLQGFEFEIQNRKMEGQLTIMIWTSLTFGIILSFPWILYQFWNFLEPALYKNEKKYSIYFILSTSLLFFTGVLFGYFIIVPLSINFLMNFEISSIITNQIDINSYISLVRTTLLASGVVFVLPVVILTLHRLGILSTDLLRSSRKYAYVIILIASAVITPPDILSQFILVIPLVILFEGSIFFSKFIKVKPAYQ